MSTQTPERSTPGRKNGRPNPAGNGMKFGRGLLGWVLFIALAVMLFVLLNQGNRNQPQIAYSEFESRLKVDKVASFEIDNDKLVGEFSNPETIDGNATPVKKFT